MEGQESERSNINECLRALIECSEAPSDPKTATSWQEQHCRSLISALENLKTAEGEKRKSGKSNSQGQFIRTNIADYNNKYDHTEASAVSIREALGNLPSSDMTKLVSALSSFLTDRVDLYDLLPATQDERANEEAMGKTAITLTTLSLAAAQLYVKFIGMPGAWGAGMIDVGAISSLGALVRRWSLECRGREQTKDGDEDGNKRKSAKTKRDPPAKRSRKKNTRRRVTAIVDSDSDDDDSWNGDDEKDAEEVFPTDNDRVDNSTVSTDELIKGGLLVCLSLGEVPSQKEFMNWSGEAREALLDASITAMATTSALLTGRVSKLGPEDVSIGKRAEGLLSRSLQNWILTKTSECEDPSLAEMKEDKERRHETSVYLLRGLAPFLSFQTEVPNGQMGKEAANDIAVSTLEGFVRSAASESLRLPQEARNCHTATRTPMSTRKRGSNSNTQKATFAAVATPLTGRKDRKKRVSFGGISDEGVVPPTLKKSATPMRSRSRSSGGNYTPTPQSGGQPRPILSAVLGMLQKLTTAKGLERANARSRMIAALEKCLPHLPQLERSHFLGFVVKLCSSKISIHRLLGVEIIGSVLSERWLWQDHGSRLTHLPHALWPAQTSQAHQKESISPPLVGTSMENIPFALFSSMHGRLSDKVPAVRARAAFSLSLVLKKFSSGEIGIHAGDDSWSAFEQVFTDISSELIVCLRKRAARDERATVKKAAIYALVQLLLLVEAVDFEVNTRLCISESDVRILSTLCSDQSVSTRKAAADALTQLLEECHYTGHCSVEAAILLEQAWSGAVLPLVLDTETSCVAKAVDLFSWIVIDPIVEVGGTSREVQWAEDEKKRRYMTAWRILAHASENSRQQGGARGEAGSLRVVLKKRFTETGSDEKAVVRGLLKEIRRVAEVTLQGDVNLQVRDNFVFQDDVEAQRIGAWYLLDAFVDVQSGDLTFLTHTISRSSIDVNFLATSWETMLQLSKASSTPESSVPALQEATKSCLKVLSKLSFLVSIDDVRVSFERLKTLIGSFSLVPALIGSTIAALVALTQKIYQDPHEIQKQCSLWVRAFYGKCQGEISSYLTSVQSGDTDMIDANEISLVRALYSVGVLSMVGFHADEDSVLRRKGSKTNTVVLQEDDPVKGLFEPPSKRLLGLVQIMLPKYLPSSNFPSGETSRRPTPEAARAHAFATLGRLCLRDEDLAKECLTIFARELHQNMSEAAPSVQSNALLVLGDLCVKYTNLVDRYLPVMAACLQCGNSVHTEQELSGTNSYYGTALVRRHAVILLSSLILQDYIKFRGLLFHRFLVASADEDPGVATLAQMTLCGPLIDRHPKLFFNNFVETVFVLNRCTAHPIYAAATMAGDNGAGIAVGFDGINFSGPSGEKRRFQMYEMMLSNMSDEEKIGITARLAKEVLAGALESHGDLSRVCRRPSQTLELQSVRESSALNVLSDSFAILTSPSLQVGKTANVDDDIKDLDNQNPNQLVAAAKGRLLSKISRKHLIEIILPILCNLKSILQTSGSPLLKGLMRYLVEIFRGYKSEVREFLANKPTLLQEVEFDAKQFKKDQEKRTPSSQQRRSTGASIMKSAPVQ